MAIGLCYNVIMGRVYRRNCDYCDNYYKGLGKMFCSSTCKNRYRAEDPSFIERLSEAQKKSWTPERRKWRSEFNKNNNIRPPGFSKGHKLGYVGYGEDNANWRGGTSSERNRIQSTKEYKDWRKAVYERDGYKCVICKVDGNGSNLNADHIKSFKDYPNLRTTLSNGRTLCVDCHRKTPNYGRPGKK